MRSLNSWMAQQKKPHDDLRRALLNETRYGKKGWIVLGSANIGKIFQFDTTRRKKFTLTQFKI